MHDSQLTRLTVLPLSYSNRKKLSAPEYLDLTICSYSDNYSTHLKKILVNLYSSSKDTAL